MKVFPTTLKRIGMKDIKQPFIYFQPSPRCYAARKFQREKAQDQGASLPYYEQLRHLLLHMQLETQALGVLVSSYCCSTYRVADPFSSLGTFSSSSIGGPVFYPIDDCQHPLLNFPGTGIASHKTAISGSFQQNLAGICKCLGRVADYGIDPRVG